MEACISLSVEEDCVSYLGGGQDSTGRIKRTVLSNYHRGQSRKMKLLKGACFLYNQLKDERKVTKKYVHDRKSRRYGKKDFQTSYPILYVLKGYTTQHAKRLIVGTRNASSPREK